jgi:SNF family Na+-dependent transporter
MALTASENTGRSWSSGFTFILAAVGAAVGLGNIWKFPYVAGVSGGGAFVLVYIACVFFVAIPILIAELLIGRSGGGSPPLAMRAVAERAGRTSKWSIVGWMGMIVGYLIATYYSVIAGWTLAYIFKAANSFGGATVADVAQQFDELLASPGTLIIWHTVFISLAMMIVGRGLRGGIESAVKLLMPALFVMLLVMIGYAAVAGDFRAGVEFLFSVDFSKITGKVVLAAIGQAFFSISVAMGLIMVYGAYVPKNVSLTRAALIIAGTDTLIAILAGLMIFPIVFANGLDGRWPGSDLQNVTNGIRGYARWCRVRCPVLRVAGVRRHYIDHRNSRTNNCPCRESLADAAQDCLHDIRVSRVVDWSRDHLLVQHLAKRYAARHVRCIFRKDNIRPDRLLHGEYSDAGWRHPDCPVCRLANAAGGHR